MRIGRDIRLVLEHIWNRGALRRITDTLVANIAARQGEHCLVTVGAHDRSSGALKAYWTWALCAAVGPSEYDISSEEREGIYYEVKNVEWIVDESPWITRW